MSVPVEPASPRSIATGRTASRGGTSTSPVAVVWCRQVDNEAESPGYTTVPEEFPGHRETLDIIRIVGNLTVNVADTHDYWDPDPAQPLSYYPNLFLYPAYGGRYTCVGRMFLSTEDRPRLGMKTLVLDTQQLLASGEFGATILRWHSSMGGPRRDGSRPPPVPDPGLYSLVGEGFLFHRGSTDPVLLVASEQWEPAMQAVLELIRVLPASLVALGAILAFPYFLPQPKTNLNEFTEQVPLSLALMRIPRGEAAGDRHSRRLGAWTSSAVTIRDLTDGVPASSPKAKDSVPLVLQYIRDHNDAKMAPIAQRVDLVELTRVRQHLADPDKQAGKDRRKEMWRIGTAMESAALLLQRARGRHVPVNVETAKRAQEYIQARVPRADSESATEEAAVVPPPLPSLAADSSALAQHPPWLQRPEEVLPAARSDRVEVVPVSVSDDPSLQKAAAPAALVVENGVPAPPPPRSGDVPSGPDNTRLRADIQRDMLRFMDERLAVITGAAAQRLSNAIETRVGSDFDARTDTKLAVARQEVALEFSRAVKELEGRLSQTIDRAVGAESEARLEARLELLQKQLSGDLAKAVVESEARTQQRIQVATGTPVDGRTDQKLTAARQAIAQDSAKLVAETEARLASRITQLSSQSTAERTEANQQLRAAGERRMSEAVEAQNRAITAITNQVQTRLEEAAAKGAQQQGQLAVALDQKVRDAVKTGVSGEVDQRLKAAMEPRFREVIAQAQEAVKKAGDSATQQIRGEVAKTVHDLKTELQATEDELRSGLSAQLDLHLREAADREIGARDTLEGRLRESIAQRFQEVEARRQKELRELEQKLGLLVDGRHRESQERLLSLTQEQQTRLASLVDERVQGSESRLGGQTEARSAEIQEAQVQATADLQVRMQSYFDTRLRETQEREREKYLELLARLKSEVDASVPRVVDSPKFDASVRDKVARNLEAFRADAQRQLEARAGEAEGRLLTAQTQAVQRLEQVEQELAQRSGQLLQLEESIRSDLEELDRRTAILSDRLVPVVRKTWQRIGELEKTNPNSTESEVKVTQLRRDLAREVRRLEGEIAEQTGEIRNRMEGSIANQGKVWLTLVRQLSQLTDDRRALERARTAESSRAINPMAPEVESGPPELDELPDLLSRDRDSPGEGSYGVGRRRGVDASDDEAEMRRRPRRTAGGR